MNNQRRTQETEKNILLRAGMEPEEIRMLADSDLTLNVQLINDFAFKKVFRNKKALTGLLSALLEIPVEKIVDLEFLDALQLAGLRHIILCHVYIDDFLRLRRSFVFRIFILVFRNRSSFRLRP